MSNSFKTAKGTELPLLKLKGKDYLQVAHRLVWFREEKQGWSIETEFLQLDPSCGFAKATVKDETGRVIATGHKFEDKQGFADFREKAETGAIGRALALCGYGTQFTDDLDEGDRIVDSPLSRPSGMPLIRPEQPPEGHGYQDDTYRIPFGQWKARVLDDIYSQFGPQRMMDYIEFIETSAKKKSTPISDDGKEFILRASKFLADKEIAIAKDLGQPED